MQYYVRYLFLILSLTGIYDILHSQHNSFASTVIEYQPAPGQFINDPLVGTPDVAGALAGKIGTPVSLGGYGGYIIFGFDEPVKNDPGNPFGIDFIIVGNAIENVAEQGIVQVMKDDNKNGLPDDKWYEIKGSDHFLHEFRSNYKIRYENQGENEDVLWTDNLYSSGRIKRNQFHTQPYYPSPEYFPAANQDSLVFYGSLLPGRVKEINGQFISERSLFGYADNTPFKGLTYPVIPDNPYTPQMEGCGGDGIDISWAVDDNNNYVDLDQIDFVKIYTGVNREAGWLGEISTEISGIIVVSPVPGVAGKTGLIAPLNLPSSLPAGGKVVIEAMIFQYGRPVTGENVIWTSSAPQVAGIEDNIISGKNSGITIITGTLESDPAVIFEQELRVFRPSLLWFPEKVIAIRTGEVRTLSFKVFDDQNKPVPGALIEIFFDNPNLIEVYQSTGNDEIILTGIRAGSIFMDVFPSGSRELAQQLLIHVYDPVPEVYGFFAMRQNDNVLIPRHQIKSTNLDYSVYIDRKPDDYNLQTGFVSLASIITEALKGYGYNTPGNTFRFRIDEKSSDELYLWQLVKDWEYIYGWGGAAEGGVYNNCWAATINGKVYLNGFDKIPVMQGDIISLNYVNDISSDFNEVVIREVEDTKTSGMARRFSVSSFTFYPDVEGRFSAVELPLSHEKILIKAESGNFETEVITDSKGVFTINLESVGVYRVWAEKYPGEVLMVSGGLTHIHPSGFFRNMKIYPNPVDNELHILSGDTGDYTFVISDLSGKKLMEGRVNTGEHAILRMDSFCAGVYIIRMRSKESEIAYKILKK